MDTRDKKILLTGGSHAELPLIEALHKLGYYVITTGNNTDGLGHKAADLYIPGDFSDKEFVLNLAKEQDVCGIISGCNDFAYISTAYACEKLGLPGHDSYKTAQLVHHKNEFCALLEKLEIKCPRTRQFSEFSEIDDYCRSAEYPLLIKAIDLTGGKGIKICNNYEEVRSAYNEARRFSRESVYIVQQYIVGSNHGGSFLVKDGKVEACFVDDEQYHLNKYLVAGACTSGHISYESKQILINDVEKVFAHLNMVDGLFHVQFILDKTGYPVMIDPCRRTPGDLYVLLATYSTGYDYPMNIVKAELGKMKSVTVGSNAPCYPRWILRECIMTSVPGKIKNIVIEKKLADNIIRKLIWGKNGDIIDNASNYKAGIVIAEFPTKEELMDIVEHFSDYAYIEVENE